MNHLTAAIKYLALGIILCGALASQAEAKKKSKKADTAVAAKAAAPAAAEPTADATAATESAAADPAAADPAADAGGVDPAAEATSADVAVPEGVADAATAGESAPEAANDTGGFGKTWGSRPDVDASAKELRAVISQLETFLSQVYGSAPSTADLKAQENLNKFMHLLADFRQMSDFYFKAKENKEINKESLITVRDSFLSIYYEKDSGLSFDNTLRKYMAPIVGADNKDEKLKELFEKGLAEIQGKISTVKNSVMATLPQ